MSVPTGIGRQAMFQVHAIAAQAPRPAACAMIVQWFFGLFSSLRAVSYLPTLWAIHACADSSQYSLLTWCTFVGANASMAAWLYQNNGRRIDRAVLVNAGNALMCLVTCLMIACYR
jgi:hypothetical protein